MIELQPEASSPQQKFGRRLVWAGVVGAVLPVALLAWTALMTRFFPDSSQCGEYTGCAGYLVQAWEVGRWVAVVLAWPLLHLLRVRPSLPVATLAAVFLAAIWWVAEALWHESRAEALALIIVSGMIAYPVAALVTTPRFSVSRDGWLRRP